MSIFGDTLKKLRNEKGITQDELSKELHLARLTISNYEQGRREPDFSTLCAFADYFGCSADYFLGRSETRDALEAKRLSELIPKAEEQLRQLSPTDRDYIIWLLTDMLKNYVSMSSSSPGQEYAREHLYSTLALNLSANTFAVLMDGVLKYASDGNSLETIKTAANKSYSIKLEMLKTIDALQAAFTKELSSTAKKAGLPNDILPDTKAITSNTKKSLETMLKWDYNSRVSK